MKEIIRAPRGTQDILPGETSKWQWIERAALESAAAFGFEEIRIPTFEYTGLYSRSVGETTDVVQKEMFTFTDRGNRSLSLRPEGTAGVLRAAIENSLLAGALPLKICYILSCFRNERPQAGRFKEFHQFGVEMLGSKSPLADAEVISLADRFFKKLGIHGLSLQINSIGCRACRPRYHQALREYFSRYEDSLCETCKERLLKNPLRILDCKNPDCAALTAQAPCILDYLCDDCESHFQKVQKALQDLQIEFRVDSGIVRGLDYYTKTVFEFISNDLGAQSTLCGGGRYDGLVEEMGGPALEGLGFAMGLERLLMVMEKQKTAFPDATECMLYLGSRGEEAARRAACICGELREEGFCVSFDVLERSVKAQMKYANKIGAVYAAIIGEEELSSGKIQLKRMADGQSKTVDLQCLKEEMYQAKLDQFAEKIVQEDFCDEDMDQ